MCSNIYGQDGIKYFKGSRFECDKDWAESIRSGDVEAERDYRIGDYLMQVRSTSLSRRWAADLQRTHDVNPTLERVKQLKDAGKQGLR